ncbi:hypothetical protein [Pseudoneobacillus rhizosphaerae]|jgi:hypothetical protein|uniref:Uncharacterized protein n=1 Tax=Pseudoneobacillus rhizosphaerae TaxID=2880968 RepID=A0A9C7GBW4_9BACI|nr:hypothetical protein [Pseudoneobacillus rhizosphaerae]CAG9609634.1 hypothetical protein NEOCIP111885_03377 [Pseudoneobacillus rhizosphaerae]
MFKNLKSLFRKSSSDNCCSIEIKEVTSDTKDCCGIKVEEVKEEQAD